MKRLFTLFVLCFLLTGFVFADEYFEGATDGTLDLNWTFNTTTHQVGDTLVVVDSTGSAWGSHVLQYQDAGYTGLVHVEDLLLTGGYTIESDIYLVGVQDNNFPLYTGVGIRMAHDATQFYRLVFRNSSTDMGQIKLQGYDGASWHISQNWNADVDFTALETGWHNFKIKVIDNKFWAYIDGKMLPGCPFVDDSPFLDQGYPGIYKYNTAYGEVLFDNFKVTTPDLFFSEYIEGTSNNKGWEIYNPTSETADLANYQIAQAVNGGGWQYYHIFPEGAMLDAGDVWVIVTDQIDPALYDTSKADEVLSYPSVTHHNGDDARALLKIIGTDTTVLDVFGDPNNDPGSGWDVAGVTNGTQDHTLIRKADVFMGETNWETSFGTNADDSEWEVLDVNTFDYLGAFPGMPTPDIVNITFRLNTSTNLDTLTAENGFVEMRGALNTVAPGNLPNDQIIAWDNTSTLEMTNVGGDYWELTVAMAPEDTLYYKYWTGFSPDQGTYTDGGWEMGFNESNGLTWDTRTFISGTTDSVLDVAYYHPKIGDGTKVDQDWSPFESKTDSIAVYFRVNMGGLMEAESFDPTVNGPIGMRGDPGNSGQVFSWDVTNIKLNWEESSIYDGSFWSGVVYFAKDSVVEGVSQSFKFFAENSGSISWEDGSDHTFKYPAGLKDTTIAWTWFSGKKITGTQPVEGIVTWRVSTEALEALGLFDRGIGDKIEVRGPRGTWSAGEVELFYNPLLQEWTSANESFKFPPGNEIFYKYFVAWDSSRFDETSANYIPGLINTDGTSRGWEEPAITGGGNRTYVFQDAAEQTVKGDFGFQRQFFNSVPANGVYDHDLTVTWQVDMTNATDADSNLANSDNLFRPGTDSVFVIWDGELIAVTQGQDMWGADNVTELKDPEGDMTYTGSFTIKVSDEFPSGWYQLGYKIAYTTDEPGVPIITQGTGGVEPGRRYMQYIHPDNIYENPDKPEFPLTEWPTAFTLPVVNWRTDTKLYVEYPPPALTEATAIGEKDILPLDFSMEQNYPNPFNPSTTIKYTMAENARVTIKVYDITGQLVKTLMNGHQGRGAHTLQWNGKNNSNINVASGMYFVEMVSGKFTKVNKMMLIR